MHVRVLVPISIDLWVRNHDKTEYQNLAGGNRACRSESGSDVGAIAQVPGTIRDATACRPSTGRRPRARRSRPAALSPIGPRMKRRSSEVADAFTRAFNAGDAKAVAALYTEDAELIDEYGEPHPGTTRDPGLLFRALQRA